jgi:ankyrin repeat protein
MSWFRRSPKKVRGDFSPRARKVTHEVFQEIFQAVRHDDVEKLRDLQQKGYDITATDSASLTALMIAAQEGSIKAARLLLDAGANVNAKRESGFTALTDAAQKGQSAMVDLLLEKGADLTHSTNGNHQRYRQDAVFWAEQMGFPSLAARLRSHTAAEPLPEVSVETSIKVRKPLSLKKAS